MEFSVTELHWAVRSNDVGMVKKLLAEGNPIQCFDSIGRTPLHWATVLGHEEALKSLLLNTSRQLIDFKDKNGRTSLHYACAGGRTQFASILIKRGASVSSKDSKGRTPLHYAAQNVKLDMVELLLKNGADKDVEDCNGVRPWDLALKWGCPDGFEVLRIESVHMGSVAESKIGCQKIVTSNNMELIRNQFLCSEKSSALDMLLSEWKKAEAQKKKTESINSLKEALKAWRDAEEETKLESQRKSMQNSVSFVEGRRDGVSAVSPSSSSPSPTSTVHTVNNLIADKGTRRVSFSAHPYGNFGSQALPSQFLHSDESKEKDKANDVLGCTEWESPLRGEEMRTITGGVERWEEMELKSRSRLPAEAWKESWFQGRDDAPASPIEAI